MCVFSWSAGRAWRAPGISRCPDAQSRILRFEASHRPENDVMVKRRPQARLRADDPRQQSFFDRLDLQRQSFESIGIARGCRR